jgi:DNA-binding NarL/FixJ family response regulator
MPKTAEAPAIKVVIADDHPLVRLALRQSLELEGEFRVLAEVETGEEAVSAVRREPPDLVLLDYQMPVLDGLGAARAIGQAHPQVGMVMLTAEDDRRIADEAAGAGVRGMVLKSDPAERLIDTLRVVAAGGNAMAPDLTVIVEPDPERSRLER